MLRKESSFVCSSCDICQSEKDASLMCTFIVEAVDSTVEEVCWCVCEDCLPMIENVSCYYEDFIRNPVLPIILQPKGSASEKPSAFPASLLP